MFRQEVGRSLPRKVTGRRGFGFVALRSLQRRTQGLGLVLGTMYWLLAFAFGCVLWRSIAATAVWLWPACCLLLPATTATATGSGLPIEQIISFRL